MTITATKCCCADDVDELGIERDKFRLVATELDSTFTELAGFQRGQYVADNDRDDDALHAFDAGASQHAFAECGQFVQTYAQFLDGNGRSGPFTFWPVNQLQICSRDSG